MTGIRIKNWVKFQHFKDRTPPWVKLYRELLDDPDWHELDGESAKVLVMLWLIASEDESHGGRLPVAKRLAFRLRISEKQLNQHITKLSHWLIFDDINAISTRYHDDAPETETETETETDILSVSAAPKPDDVPAEAILAGYRELLPDLPQPRKLDPDRKKKIITRWREDPERQSLDWWRNFWAYVAQSDFLTGRDGKWQSCNLDWLLEPKNMRKVTEGNYENRGTHESV